MVSPAREGAGAPAGADAPASVPPRRALSPSGSLPVRATARWATSSVRHAASDVRWSRSVARRRTRHASAPARARGWAVAAAGLALAAGGWLGVGVVVGDAGPGATTAALGTAAGVSGVVAVRARQEARGPLRLPPRPLPPPAPWTAAGRLRDRVHAQAAGLDRLLGVVHAADPGSADLVREVDALARTVEAGLDLRLRAVAELERHGHPADLQAVARDVEAHAALLGAAAGLAEAVARGPGLGSVGAQRGGAGAPHRGAAGALHGAAAGALHRAASDLVARTAGVDVAWPTGR